MGFTVAIRDNGVESSEVDLAHLVIDFMRAGGVVTDDTDYPNSFDVQAQVTPDMTVKVKEGVAYVKTLNQLSERMVYRVEMDADSNVTIPDADITYARIDVIYLMVDVNLTPDSDGSNIALLGVEEGTPAATPSAPAIDSSYVKLGEVYVPKDATATTQSRITDYRSECRLIPYLGWGSGDLVAGAVGADQAPTLLSILNRGAAVIGGTPPAPSVGGFLWQAGTVSGSVNSNSYFTFQFTEIFPNGVLALICTDASVEQIGRSIVHLTSSSDKQSQILRITRAEDDGNLYSLGKADVVVNYIALGW